MTVYEKTKQALERAEKLGGKSETNCVAEIDTTALLTAQQLDAAKPEKHHPIWGTPILVKDNIDVKGLYTTAGSLALKDNIAQQDAPIIQNLRKNGAVIIGKTNMTEFANYTSWDMPNGYSSRGGQVVHAIDAKLDPSGSSSGSGVAVSAGIVEAAVGTDTSFSIIACAQANGVCGIKPPHGVLQSDGIIPIARTLDSAGPMAKDFTMALNLYSAMRDEPLLSLQPQPVEKMKIAVNTAHPEYNSDENKAFLDKLITLFKKQGASVSEIVQEYTDHQNVIMQWEFKPHLEQYLATSAAGLKTLEEIVQCYENNPETMMKYGIRLLKAALDETPDGLQGEPYLEAMEQREEFIANLGSQIEEYDAVVVYGYTNIMHLCGLPSVTVASKTKDSNGVPFCAVMYGTDEYRLYSTALAIEKLCNNEL
ncbi:MAG: hypothetical protein J6C04_01205 [Oscillospiraceae bacterium]|nr:hypothetical protein [Oscillospiraceae bacterium]